MYNKMTCLARLASDVELKTIPSGKKVAEFSVAMDNGFGDGKKVTFISCSAWEKTAELINQYYNKGDPIFFDARLNMDTWDDKDSGKKRTKHTLVVDRLTFLPKAKDGDSKPKEKVVDESWNKQQEISEIPF